MRDLSFRKQKKRINYDLLREILIWVGEIVGVCLLAFTLVWLFGLRVSTIGDSMKPILRNGDVVMVNRVIYDATAPGRGDIIVFKPNGNENTHYYIKRLIGLPGETVEIKDGSVFINGKQLKESYTTTAIDDPGIAAEPVELKENEYFVLGDNRKSSEDSRTADIGNVKRQEIEGKAWFVVSPKDNFGFIKKEK